MTLDPVKRTLSDTKLGKADVHAIVLVVSCGAALLAANLTGDGSETMQDLMLLEVTPLSLGMDIFTTCYDNQTRAWVMVYEAVEMSSGKQNSMIVTTNKGCLLEAEIERMVNDAEKLKQEDEKARSRMAVKNRQNILTMCETMIRWMDDDQQATKEKCKLLYKNLETLYSSTMAMRNLGS
ncbi:Heat shock cognate protein [Echinococcus granulosus]|uniref:Heat shock cognate protein n=1 Tax=Echinococcus granulosus TaxID=6210 RepID=W6UAM5_ECHGR|nr:Heat shock cognate protein [Echinococcus granulosus]EUB58140.1 Heat shock cognate protein [Echinococcus granulosus]